MHSYAPLILLMTTFISFNGIAEESAFSWANLTAIKEVVSGTRTEANAAWWGFNGEDATDSLQAAINSGAKRVIVPYTGQEWIIRPISLVSDQELIFEPGVVVLAKKGEFKGGGDSLFSAKKVHNLKITGYGATFKMRKKDYQSSDYKKAEWRMTLDLVSCTNVSVEGLRLESSGGDGIYVGSAGGAQPYCENITIRDVVSVDHHRQGISVISAVNLLIENSVFNNTKGTAPEAGIDFEPNSPDERLENCVVRRCQFDNNSGAGMQVYLRPMSGGSPKPISLLFEDCVARGNGQEGMVVGAITSDGPKGSIEFRNCVAEATCRPAIQVYDKAPNGSIVRFVDCSAKGGEDNPNVSIPIQLNLRRESVAKAFGGVKFENLHVYDKLRRAAVRVLSKDKEFPFSGICGTIIVHNSNGAGLAAPEGMQLPDLLITTGH